MWIALFAIGASHPGSAGAQATDSTRVGVAPLLPRDTSAISPRGAFLRSLVLPGWGQAKLDRGTAGALFAVTEAMTVAMTVKSRRTLNDARRARGDSLFVGFELAPDGSFALDSLGNRVAIYQADPLGARARSRRQQFEDWLALLVFNHLFAGADAFVAAHLSDLPPRISVQRTEQGFGLSASLAW